MRIYLWIVAAAVLAGTAPLTAVGPAYAAAEQCTGENCPPPSGQGSGHDCERKKKEDTVS